MDAGQNVRPVDEWKLRGDMTHGVGKASRTVATRTTVNEQTSRVERRAPGPATVQAPRRRRREAPERDASYDHMSLTELRELRNKLWAEEGRVSYWRRILQAKLDLIVNGAASSGATPEALTKILNTHLGRSRRDSPMPLLPVDGAEPIPDLIRLWSMPTDDGTDAEDFVAALSSAESALSRRRTGLHQEIDRVTGQLIARYREDPTLVFSALPVRPGEAHRF